MSVKCSIPDDHIVARRSALFMARSILGEVRDEGWTADFLAQAGHDDAEGLGGDLASAEPAWVLADRYGISEQTVWT